MTFEESRRIFVWRASGSSDGITVNGGKQQKKEEEKSVENTYQTGLCSRRKKEKKKKKKREKKRKSGRDTLNTVQMNATRPRRMKRLTVHDN